MLLVKLPSIRKLSSETLDNHYSLPIGVTVMLTNVSTWNRILLTMLRFTPYKNWYNNPQVVGTHTKNISKTNVGLWNYN